MNNSLIGIEIEIGGIKRFVGKVCTIPENQVIPKFKGVRVLYKEELWTKFYSYSTDSVGIDSAAWLTAKDHGAEGMIVFCKDKAEMWCIKGHYIDSAPLIDLNEGREHRIPLSRCYVAKNASGLQKLIGYTRNVVLVRPAAEKTFESAFNESTSQTQMF